MKALFTILFLLGVISCSFAQTSSDSISILAADSASFDAKTGVSIYSGNVSFKNNDGSVVHAQRVVHDKNGNKLTAYNAKGSIMASTIEKRNSKDKKNINRH